MKKYLITAAVFLTGTALANAATVTDATLPTGFVWTAADITLSRSGSTSGSGNTLANGRETTTEIFSSSSQDIFTTEPIITTNNGGGGAFQIRW